MRGGKISALLGNDDTSAGVLPVPEIEQSDECNDNIYISDILERSNDDNISQYLMTYYEILLTLRMYQLCGAVEAVDVEGEKELIV